MCFERSAFLGELFLNNRIEPGRFDFEKEMMENNSEI